MNLHAYREVSLETLLNFYRDELEHSSIRSIARRVGVNKGVVHKFLAGSQPHPRTRRLLALYYLEKKPEKPFKDALAVLVGDDAELQRQAAAGLIEICQSAGESVPPGLAKLAEPV